MMIFLSVDLFFDELELAVEDCDRVFEGIAALEPFTSVKHDKLGLAAAGMMFDDGKSGLPAVVSIDQEGRHRGIVADCIILPLSAHHPAAVHGQKLVEFLLVEANIRPKSPIGVLVVRKADNSDHRRE